MELEDAHTANEDNIPTGMLFFSSKPQQDRSGSRSGNEDQHVPLRFMGSPIQTDSPRSGMPMDTMPDAHRESLDRYSELMMSQGEGIFGPGESSESATNRGTELPEGASVANVLRGEGGAAALSSSHSPSSEDGLPMIAPVGMPSSPPAVIAINTSTLGPGETTTVDGVTYNSRGYEVCGQLNQHSKPCQRIGRCPFHGAKKTPLGKIRRHAVKKSPYKQGWTKEEHLRFLNGLQIHGKGAWKEIANIVGTRTPTQIQSHAQKYYLRQKQEVKNKRSIHDISLNDMLNGDTDSIRAPKSEASMGKPRPKVGQPSMLSRIKNRRGGNLPFTSHMLLQPAASTLASPPPGTQPQGAGFGNMGAMPRSPDHMQDGQGVDAGMPAGGQQLHPRSSSPYPMQPHRVQSPPVRHYQPAPVQQEHPHFRPQPLPTSYSSLRSHPSGNTHSLSSASISPPTVSSSSPHHAQYSGGYTMGMPPPSSNVDNLLAPMTAAAFTPFTRPSGRGEGGGSYLLPPQQRAGGSERGGDEDREGDMLDMELELLRSRSPRRFRSPPPNTFQPIISLQGQYNPLNRTSLQSHSRGNIGGPSFPGDPANISHLLRPVHSPVPTVPPGSRLPPMASSPPPTAASLYRNHHDSGTNAQAGFSLPSNFNRPAGNPYAQQTAQPMMSSFSFIRGTDAPASPSSAPSHPSTMPSLSCPPSQSPSLQSSSPTMDTSAAMKAENSQPILFPHVLPPREAMPLENLTRSALSPTSCMTGGGYASGHFTPPPHSHPGRDSAEPTDDVQLTHQSEEGGTYSTEHISGGHMSTPDENQELNLQRLIGGPLAMLSSSPMNDDSEDEHMQEVKERSHKRRKADDMPQYSNRGREGGVDQRSNRETQNTTLEEEDTSSYFSAD